MIPPTPEDLFVEEDFVVDEILLGGIAEYLKSETALQMLDIWRRRKIEAIDDAVQRYKYQAVADKDD